METLEVAACVFFFLLSVLVWEVCVGSFTKINCVNVKRNEIMRSEDASDGNDYYGRGAHATRKRKETLSVLQAQHQREFNYCAVKRKLGWYKNEESHKIQ